MDVEENLGTRCQNSIQDERLGSSTRQVRGNLGGSERGKSMGVDTSFGK